jgi:hypothetical protein
MQAIASSPPWNHYAATRSWTSLSDGGRNLSENLMGVGNKRATDEMELYLKMEPNAPDAGRLRKTIEELRQKQ